jgi:hypothetical protein
MKMFLLNFEYKNMSGADRIRQQPGGNSSFSFGWGSEEKKETEEDRKKREEAERKKKEDEESAKKNQEEQWRKALDDARSSKPRAPPGGASSISFG